MRVLALHAEDILAIAGVILVWVALRTIRRRTGRRRARPDD